MRGLATLFKALSDETRLRMVGLVLTGGELCVCDFVDVLGITQSKASRHLRALVNAGLLADRREASWVYFRVADDLGAAQARLLEVLPAMLAGAAAPGLAVRLGRSKERQGRTSTDEASRCCSPKTRGGAS
jgi:ArsR family transcriptional regulator